MHNRIAENQIQLNAREIELVEGIYEKVETDATANKKGNFGRALRAKIIRASLPVLTNEKGRKIMIEGERG